MPGSPLRRGTHTDITERQRQEALAWRQARIDTLTGLPSRRASRERIDHARAQHAMRGEALAVMCVDLDHFKEINDSLGHDGGDALLAQVAGRLQGCMPTGGWRQFVCRRPHGWGRVHRVDCRDPGRARGAACWARLAEDAVRRLRGGGGAGLCAACIGVCLAPHDGLEIETLFKHADLAWYEAKGAGRNRMVLFTPALHQATQRRTRLATELREALRLQQLSLVYQPILSLREPGALPRKAEALLRCQHPQLGDVSPAQLVPIAEANGLIVDIGEWVFREAAAQALAWREGFQISINKSPVQFLGERSHRTQTDWAAHLRDLRLSGDALAVEIT
jgi:predicted signal transduction protein with EAL and GGDEF domain